MNPDEFITEMNNSEQYGRIFKIMVRGRRLLLVLAERNPDHVPIIVAHNLFNPTRGLNWNNAADRVPKMRVEADNILRELRAIDGRVDRLEPTDDQREEARSLIISLENYLTETAATTMTNTYNIPSNEDSDSDYGGSAKSLRKRNESKMQTKNIFIFPLKKIW
jgi:hypothetical protein